MLDSGKSVEITYNGMTYAISPDQNKGCDFISVWLMSDVPVVVGRLLTDLSGPMDDSEFEELCSIKCFGGKNLNEVAELEFG